MTFGRMAWMVLLCAGAAVAQAQSCDMKDWKPIAGVSVTASHSGVEIVWPGEHGQQNRARFALRDGQPVVEELAAKKASGAWIVLGKNLQPEFQVTTGRRRISTTELDILEAPPQRHTRSRGRVQMERFLGCAPGDSRPRLASRGSGPHSR